jgi:hypothetical protein
VSVSVKALEKLDEIVPGARRQRLGIDASGKRNGDAKLFQVGGAIGTGPEMTLEAPALSSAK